MQYLKQNKVVVVVVVVVEEEEHVEVDNCHH
jgi:hypothetical protein